MPLSRRTGQRFQGSIWPGFVDAMTGLLLVLMFVLTIFMVVQFVLRETISGQETELDALSSEVSALALALGLEERESNQLEARLGALNSTLNQAQDNLDAAQAELVERASIIATLTAERDAQNAALSAAQTQITGFEAQVAALLADRDRALSDIASLQQERDALDQARTELLSEQEALNLALAQSRSEIDAQTEAARLAAARREALEALVADLEKEGEANAGRITSLEQKLTDEEAARLAEATAAEALRERLQNADAELTAMTLALEQQRQDAEDTLTLLAAADVARDALQQELAQALEQIEIAQAQGRERDELAERLTRALAQMELTQSEQTAQVDTLEGQLAQAQADLDAARARVAGTQDSKVEVEARLLQALEELERAQVAVSDQDVLQARLLAALNAQDSASQEAASQRSLAEERAALLAKARETLADEQEISAEAQRQTALLNQQVAALRTQLGGLQALLDDFKDRDAAAQVQLQTLGQDLNAALARAASEERKRRLLEEAERKRLEAEAIKLAEEALALQAQAKDLEQYRSEFFGRLRGLLGDQEGVRIEGDRFVFSSEVLFDPGSADLSVDGQFEIAKVARILQSIASEIPSEIDWVIRVDGHTDNVPLFGTGKFSDNWELSQGRALSVVRYMVEFLGIPPDRLSANGFGEYQPLNTADSPEARAQNRRIELKLTEK
ncbi:peptidoglycan -binding protein [Tropicibacter sp. Alg240-R139]|uniref:peptidoglycan -binding protein n=1 Tax=Tropicibacter sp. Alg240-R139 TaxID=2305991 RepID=UPI0013DFB69C|nr:peptidoglycan -binding protein [Tropicibacter sp. Alg240-R139]